MLSRDYFTGKLKYIEQIRGSTHNRNGKRRGQLHGKCWWSATVSVAVTCIKQTMKKINLFDIPDEDERGVSPVIGVILMVAITVILAAVIATFVLGFPDQVNNNVNAGVTIEATDGGNATVTWVSQGNAENITILTDPAEGSSDVNISSSNLGGVGETATVYLGSDTGSQSVTITAKATGSGGSATVVSQKQLNLTA